MKKKKVKTLEVQKFGGTENLGAVKEVGNSATFKSEMSGAEYTNDEVNWDTKSIEVKSDTKLEDDEGYGKAALIRKFTFGINPQAFLEVKPTKQQLFNYHLKGIEIMLWRDGLKMMTEVDPKVVLDAENMQYHIFVGAQPQKGHILRERPMTLSEVAHGRQSH